MEYVSNFIEGSDTPIKQVSELTGLSLQEIRDIYHVWFDNENWTEVQYQWELDEMGQHLHDDGIYPDYDQEADEYQQELAMLDKSSKEENEWNIEPQARYHSHPQPFWDDDDLPF